MESSNKFDIIVTVWNRLDYTKRTFASLISSGAVDACERLIIVDNRSTEEGTDAFLNDMYNNMPNVSHKVFLVKRNQNDGWGMAVNDALGLSRAPYLLLCNNDVEFDHDFVPKAFDVYNQQNIARGKEIGILALWRHIAHGEQVGGVKNEWFVELDNVPAVAWLMPKTAMMQVGMLPEHGPCFTKGGNGEDTKYVMMMKEKGFLIGTPTTDLAHHIDGY